METASFIIRLVKLGFLDTIFRTSKSLEMTIDGNANYRTKLQFMIRMCISIIQAIQEWQLQEVVMC